MNKMQQAARKLHALGFKTLPIKPGTKEPATAHGVKDATDKDVTTDAYYAMHPNHGIGVSGDGFVIFDFDVKDGVDGRDQLLDFDLPETLAQTTPSGGYHMFYRTGDDIRPSVNSEMAVDVRGWHSYVVCDPTPGYCFEDDEIGIADADESVMRFLDHVRPNSRRDKGTRGLGRKKESHSVGEGGRNDYLFREGRSMRSDESKGDDEIRAYLHGLNFVNCKPPLSDEEVDKIADSVLTVAPGHSEEVKQQAKRGRPRKFEHNKVARKLIDEYGACLVDGETPALRKDKTRYYVGWEAFDAAIIDMHDDCTVSNRKEVKAYIQAKAEVKKQSSPYLMAFKNGVLDVRTLELRDWRDDDVICNVIPHAWNPDARSDVLDRTLEKMACGDISTLLNLTEFIGVCMVRSAKLCPFFPVLIGVGSNGKSTYIELIKDVVGNENISGLQPKEITAHFLGSHIVGKTANLGDDIASGYLDDKDCSIIKSIATGDLMFTDVKGGKGFHFQPYCTMVFSCNQFPRLADTTPGFMRRLFPIEFNAVFSASDADYDPMIGDKLRQEETLEYACLIGVEGLRRVIDNHMPTPNELSESMKSDIAREANTAMQWFHDDSITADYLRGKTKEEIYQKYIAWCERNGYSRTALGSGALVSQIGTLYRVKLTKISHRNYVDGRKTVREFE